MPEHLSTSGKYKLTITQKPTKPGCWDYTTGEVTTADGKTITIIDRNYSSFPFTFIENHPNGHDYLVCGEDYQGQTVIELDTNTRRNHLPDTAKDGHAFCWAESTFDVASQILVVSGCHWACPYEYRFYDFSSPMDGWPEIESDGDAVEYAARVPEISGDTIKTFEMVSYDEDDGVSEELASVKTWQRDGNKLIFLDEWVSEKEKDRRQKNKEARERYAAEIRLFKETDALYLKYKELIKDMPNSNNYCSIGWCYDGWRDFFKDKERRYCHRIHAANNTGNGYVVDLEWAMKTGPIKLVIFKDGKTHETKWYEHSIKGMEEAFTYAKSLIAIP